MQSGGLLDLVFSIVILNQICRNCLIKQISFMLLLWYVPYMKWVLHILGRFDAYCSFLLRSLNISVVSPFQWFHFVLQEKVAEYAENQKLATPCLSEKSYHFSISVIAFSEYPSCFSSVLKVSVGSMQFTVVHSQERFVRLVTCEFRISCTALRESTRSFGLSLQEGACWSAEELVMKDGKTL